jgi:hypothetical protein
LKGALLQAPPPSNEQNGIYREDGLAMTPRFAKDQLPRFFIDDSHDGRLLSIFFSKVEIMIYSKK